MLQPRRPLFFAFFPRLSLAAPTAMAKQRFLALLLLTALLALSFSQGKVVFQFLSNRIVVVMFVGACGRWMDGVTFSPCGGFVMERRAGGSAERAGAAARRAARGAPRRRPPAAGGDGGVHDDGLRAPHGQHQHPRRHEPVAGPLLAADALTGSDRPVNPPATALFCVSILLVRSLFGIGREKKTEGRGSEGRSSSSSPLARTAGVVLYLVSLVPSSCGVCTVAVLR